MNVNVRISSNFSAATYTANEIVAYDGNWRILND